VKHYTNEVKTSKNHCYGMTHEATTRRETGGWIFRSSQSQRTDSNQLSCRGGLLSDSLLQDSGPGFIPHGIQTGNM